MKIQSTTLIIALFATVAGGCEFTDGGLEEGDVGETEQGLTTTNKLAMNKLAMNKLAMNGANLDLLTTYGLDSLKYSFTYDLQDADARYFMKYAVQCALDEDQSVTFRYYDPYYKGGYHYVTYSGWLGYAPEWKTGKCGTKCQQEVTGCLLARTNYKGISVPISLRDWYEDTPDIERFYYYKAEGAFYGNIFADTTNKPLYFCSAMTTEHEGSILGWNRWCGENYDLSTCNYIKYTGPCNDFYSNRRACYYQKGSSGYSPAADDYYPSAYLYCMDGDYATQNPAPEHWTWYKYPIASHRYYSY